MTPNASLSYLPECSDPDDAEYNETDDSLKLEYVAYGPVGALLIGMGLIGNVLCLLVFATHSKPRPAIYLYLMALAVWDMALLISAALLYTVQALFFPNTAVGPYVPTFPYWYYLGNATLVGTVWIVTVLSIDRYLALCHPLQHRRLSKRFTRRLLYAVSAAVCCYSFPRFFELQIVHCRDVHTGSVENIVIPSNLRQNHVYHSLYKVFGGLTFYSLLPFMILLLLTIRISLQLRRAVKQRARLATSTGCQTQKMSQVRRASNNQMLLIVILKSLFCHVLPTTLDLLEVILPASSFSGNPIIMHLVVICNVLVIMNSSSNFWVYLICSRSFRHGSLRILKGDCTRQRYSALRAAIPAMREMTASIMRVHAVTDDLSNGERRSVNTSYRNGMVTLGTPSVPYERSSAASTYSLSEELVSLKQ